MIASTITKPRRDGQTSLTEIASNLQYGKEPAHRAFISHAPTRQNALEYKSLGKEQRFLLLQFARRESKASWVPKTPMAALVFALGLSAYAQLNSSDNFQFRLVVTVLGIITMLVIVAVVDGLIHMKTVNSAIRAGLWVDVFEDVERSISPHLSIYADHAENPLTDEDRHLPRWLKKFKI